MPAPQLPAPALHLLAPALYLPAPTRARPRRALFLRPHLQGEGPQRRDGNEGGHEEGHHVVDGRECDAGARAEQTLAHALLPGQGRGLSLRGTVKGGVGTWTIEEGQ